MRACENVSGVGLAGLLLIEADQLSGLFVRQRRHQHRLDDAEHGGRAADADAERGRDHGRKPGLRAQLPTRVPQIPCRLLEPPDAVHVQDVLRASTAGLPN